MLRLIKGTLGLFKIGTLRLDIISLFYAFNKKKLKQTNDKQTKNKINRSAQYLKFLGIICDKI